MTSIPDRSPLPAHPAAPAEIRVGHRVYAVAIICVAAVAAASSGPASALVAIAAGAALPSLTRRAAARRRALLAAPAPRTLGSCAIAALYVGLCATFLVALLVASIADLTV